METLPDLSGSAGRVSFVELRAPEPFAMGHGGIAKETFCLMTGMSIVQFPPHIGQVVLRGSSLSTFRSKLSVLPAARSAFSEYCAQRPRRISAASKGGGPRRPRLRLCQLMTGARRGESRQGERQSHWP